MRPELVNRELKKINEDFCNERAKGRKKGMANDDVGIYQVMVRRWPSKILNDWLHQPYGEPATARRRVVTTEIAPSAMDTDSERVSVQIDREKLSRKWTKK